MSLAENNDVSPRPNATVERGADEPWSGASMHDRMAGTAQRAAISETLAGLAASNFAIAITALTEGAKNIEDLHAKCEQLRSELAVAEHTHRSCLLTIKDQILTWQDTVDTLVEHYRNTERQLEEAAKCRALDQQRAENDLKRVEAADRRSAAFERLVLNIHDEILAAVVKERCQHSVFATLPSSSEVPGKHVMQSRMGNP